MAPPAVGGNNASPHNGGSIFRRFVGAFTSHAITSIAAAAIAALSTIAVLFWGIISTHGQIYILHVLASALQSPAQGDKKPDPALMEAIRNFQAAAADFAIRVATEDPDQGTDNKTREPQETALGRRVQSASITYLGKLIETTQKADPPQSSLQGELRTLSKKFHDALTYEIDKDIENVVGYAQKGELHLVYLKPGHIQKGTISAVAARADQNDFSLFVDKETHIVLEFHIDGLNPGYRLELTLGAVQARPESGAHPSTVYIENTEAVVCFDVIDHDRVSVRISCKADGQTVSVSPTYTPDKQTVFSDRENTIAWRQLMPFNVRVVMIDQSGANNTYTTPIEADSGVNVTVSYIAMVSPFIRTSYRHLDK